MRLVKRSPSPPRKRGLTPNPQLQWLKGLRARICAGAAAVLVAVSATSALGSERYDPRLRFRTITTPRFDIHFHQGEEAIAKRLAAVAEQVATEIRTKLRAFLEVPLVTLTVHQAISARFYVVGEVGTSGAFPLTGRITVVQAIALAGGFRTFAKRERIVIIRERLGVRSAIPFNFRDLEAGVRLEQNIPLLSGDIIIVP